MVLRTAGRGAYQGQQFWGCSTFPRCRARIALSQVAESDTSATHPPVPLAGASAQARFERLRSERTKRIRQAWPLIVGLTLVAMLAAYLVAHPLVGPAWAGAAAAAVALLFVMAVVEIPQAIDAWRIGAEGERKTAGYLEGLAEGGFVVLHDRKVPGYGGNVDHVAIGPSGVWAIETKNLKGKVEIAGDSLHIGGRRRDSVVDQVYREAIAVQVALGPELDKVGISVTPVVCLHRGELPWFNKTVRGVRLASGRQLVRLLKSGEPRLSAEQVTALAVNADRRLPPALRSS